MYDMFSKLTDEEIQTIISGINKERLTEISIKLDSLDKRTKSAFESSIDLNSFDSDPRTFLGKLFSIKVGAEVLYQLLLSKKVIEPGFLSKIYNLYREKLNLNTPHPTEETKKVMNTSNTEPKEPKALKAPKVVMESNNKWRHGSKGFWVHEAMYQRYKSNQEFTTEELVEDLSKTEHPLEKSVVQAIVKGYLGSQEPQSTGGIATTYNSETKKWKIVRNDGEVAVPTPPAQ